MMEDNKGEDSQDGGAPTMKNACDACRARKVRCDRTNPCSNCRAVKTTCRFSPKTNDNRQRILISSRYESKVESIDDRLSGIEKSLQTLVANLPKGGSQLTPAEVTSTPLISKLVLRKSKPQSHSVGTPQSDITDTYEGDTSFKAHSLHAKGLFEILSSTTSARRSVALRDALTSLQNTLKAEADPEPFDELRFSSEQEVKFTGHGDLELPPMQAVLDVMRSFGDRVPRLFLEAPLIEWADFADLCRNLWFCTTDYSPAHFAIVNGGLHMLFAEFSSTLSEESAATFMQYAEMCRINFELTIQNLNLCVTPTIETCQALLYGAYYASELSRPALCHRLTTVAAQMCQAMGFHRLPATNVDTKELRMKKHLFWGVYCMDKALSLRLGCTSFLHDSDISTTTPSAPEEDYLRPWYSMYLCWIEFAKFQGQVYSELYTVRALEAPPDHRANQVRRLATNLKAWVESWSKLLDIGDMLYAEEFQLNLSSMQVAYYSLLTITYRAMPLSPGDISTMNSDCVVAARKALELHRDLATRYQRSSEIWQGYINWTLVYSPFAPFMVVFLEAVMTINLVDLECLAAFVSSIQPTAEASKGSQRLYHLCAAFYQVAKVYLEESVASSMTPESTSTQNPFAVSQASTQRGYESFPNMMPDGQTISPNFAPGMVGNPMDGPFGADNYMAWPTEDWSVPDMYMMGITDTSFRGNP